jgi:hypothetical protein
VPIDVGVVEATELARSLGSSRGGEVHRVNNGQLVREGATASDSGQTHVIRFSAIDDSSLRLAVRKATGDTFVTARCTNRTVTGVGTRGVR